MDADELELGGNWKIEWELYTHSLSMLGIRITSPEDRLVWVENKKNGMVTVKLAYRYIMEKSNNLQHNRFWMLFWKWKIPMKIKCFSWLCLMNKISTWDNLCNRGWIGPNFCHLCREASESVNHLCNVPNFALGHNGKITFSIFMKVVKGMLKVK